MHTEQISEYDILIAGGGLSGLTLAVALCGHPYFEQFRIALVDKSDKNTNDRTWSFWMKEGDLELPFVLKTWDKAQFFSPLASRNFSMHPYRYHTIRSADFYSYCKEKIKGRIDWIKDEIEHINPNEAILKNRGAIKAEWIFNSAIQKMDFYPKTNILHESPYFSVFQKKGEKETFPKHKTLLLQHFMGYFIKTPKPVFDADSIHFMDFRVPQCGETRFFYVLPFDEKTALIEYTLFSKNILEKIEYENAISEYLKSYFDLHDYEIIEREFGIIPMTDFRFEKNPHPSIFNIGMAGGFVKASSGYAFLRTQKIIRQLVNDWAIAGVPMLQDASVFKNWMDAVLLRVLANGRLTGAEVFGHLFRSCPPEFVLRFLDEETSFLEDLSVMRAVPMWPFMRSVF